MSDRSFVKDRRDEHWGGGDLIVVRTGPQIRAIAGRSIRSVARQPQLWAPSIVFPLLFTALSSAAFDRTREIPGFPSVSSFVAYLLAATVVQGVMFGSTTAGNDVALDIESGFFDRMVVSPVARVALIMGRLAGTMALAVAQAVVFVVILMFFGATMEAGLGGLLVTLVVAALFGGAVGAFAMAVGLKTGSVEAVNGFFPILFALVFLSSAFFPPEISGGWFERVADLNPLSYMVDGMRELHISGWDLGDAAMSIGVALGLLTCFVLLALAALRDRLRA